MDFESHLVQPGLLAPPIVCGSWAWWEGDHVAGAIGTPAEVVERLIAALRDPHAIIVGQNLAFDLLVAAVWAQKHLALDLMPLIFAAYREGRCYDIATAEKLHAIANGHLFKDPRTGGPLRDPETGESHKVGYRLSVLVDLVLGRVDAKRADRFRKSYALLEGTPIALWPLEARAYPVDDAVNTLETALAQTGHIPRVGAHDWGWDTAIQGPRCNRCQTADTSHGARGCTFVGANANLHDLSRQVFAAWAMHLGAAWGFYVDADAVEELERKVALFDENGEPTERWRSLQRFVEAGFIRADGSEDQAAVKRAVAIAYGATKPCEVCAGTGKVPSPKTPKNRIQCKACSATGFDRAGLPIPETEKGGVGKGKDPLIESGDELLMAYGGSKEDQKIGSTYLPWLRGGVGVPLTLKPNELVETGRTSYGGAAQTTPRAGGIRECVKARPGRILGSCDYEMGELVTHAQNLIWTVGYSNLAQALVNGVKPHNALGAKLLGVSYEEFNRRLKAKDKTAGDLRQTAKPANFGFPGRMGAWKLVLQQRKGGPDTPHPEGPVEIAKGVRGYRGLRFCLLMGEAKRCGETMVTTYKRRTGPPTCAACIRAAERLRADWLAQWPENGAYFNFVQSIEDSGKPVVHHVSQRVRGGAEGNAIANGFFQGLLADAAKDGLCEVAYECYAVPTSPLYGSRVIVFTHDENIPEYPIEVAHEAAHRTGYLMEESLKRYCPDLAPAVRAAPALMTVWTKGAEPKYLDLAGAVCERETPGARLVAWK